MSATLEISLARGVAGLHIDLPVDAEKRLLEYLLLLQKWNRIHNLTAVRDPYKMVTHHLLDSLAVLDHIKGSHLVDVGSGAGLPGIPIAIARPAMQVVLIESSHKKSAFLRQVIGELGLGNVSVECARVENWRPERGFEIVISRAFADLAEFLTLGRHLLSPGGVFAAMKGLHPHEELAQMPKAYRLKAIVPLVVPGLDAQRHLVLIEAV